MTVAFHRSDMSKADDLTECTECVPPADAFALIADETRIAILEALWKLETPARFSDTRAAVGMADSAQFNYHLGKLTDQFVRKTDSGYELQTAGERIVQAILAGSFTEHPTREIEIDDSCVVCGGSLCAQYDDEMLQIECRKCGHGHGQYSFPPGGLHGRTDTEVLDAFDQRVRHLHCLAKDGVCPECNGRMQTQLEEGADCCLGASLRANHVCQQCSYELCSAVGLGLLDHSAVVSFYDDHGVQISETPYWQFRWCVDDHTVNADPEGPGSVSIEMPVEQELLQVIVDDELSAIHTKRITID
jgi:hypothetical protein